VPFSLDADGEKIWGPFLPPPLCFMPSSHVLLSFPLLLVRELTTSGRRGGGYILLRAGERENPTDSIGNDCHFCGERKEERGSGERPASA